jgi:histidine ammonia-lyase
MNIILDGKSLTLSQVEVFLEDHVKVHVTPETTRRLKQVRAFVEKKLKSHEPYYGINTGFGMLAGKRIADRDLELLQENLIVSHAVGVGDYLPENISRLIMLLRANVLAAGYSGIRPETLGLIIEMINRGVTPVIPEKGSVGASGDLAQLSHIALAMIGKGMARFKGEIMKSARALKLAKLKPIKLAPKEGIALINGTQAMEAIALICVIKARRLLKLADISGALSVEGDRASKRPFDPRIHAIRPHPGQIATANNIRRLIEGSQIIESHAKCKRVQDPYSFRCIPQVHGAVKDAANYATSVVLRELNSCTDNPLIFHEDGEIISGGNFHGEPLAIAMDVLAIALAELASISERRVSILLAPLEGELPVKYLVLGPGLNSGLAPLHVTMASIVSENKTLAHPASVDSIPTFAGQEDHVSMGYFAARKAATVVRNVEMVLAIEFLAACQAIDIKKGEKRPLLLPGKGTRAAYNLIRREIPFMERDREVKPDFDTCLELVQSGILIEAVEKNVGALKL